MLASVKKVLRIFVLGLACCGGAPNNTASVAPLPSATATVQTPIAHRGPSDALVRAWPLDSSDGVAYFDVAGVAGTKSVAALIAATGPILGPPIFNPEEAACARGLIVAMREIAIGVVGNDMVFVARVAGDLPPLGSCVDGIAPIEMAGAKQAYKTGNDVVAVGAGGIFVYAERSIAERALKGDNDGRALRAMELRANEYGVVDYASDGDKGHVSVVVSDQRFAANASLDFKDEESARSLMKFVGSMPTDAGKFFDAYAKPDERAMLDKLVRLVHAKADGHHVDLAFELAEPAADQGRDVGVVVNGAVRTVRKFVDSLTKMEATFKVDDIAKAIVTDFDAQTTPFAKRKLRSFPAVPKVVPRGVKVQTKPDEWAAWSPIKFSITTPQHYQYEVKAAPNGESAEVIAHGDLDGDGKLSTFTLEMHIDRKAKQVVVAPAPVTNDPDE
jgi:hypothetical protein